MAGPGRAGLLGAIQAGEALKKASPRGDFLASINAGRNEGFQLRKTEEQKAGCECLA